LGGPRTNASAIAVPLFSANEIQGSTLASASPIVDRVLEVHTSRGHGAGISKRRPLILTMRKPRLDGHILTKKSQILGRGFVETMLPHRRGA
jgi:hypothetical protein